MMKVLAASIVFACLAIPARAEPVTPELLDLQGAEIFRALLLRSGLKPVSSVADAELSATVLVIYGRCPTDAEVAKLSQRLLGKGGAVLIATNRHDDLTRYFRDGGGHIVIDGRTAVVRGKSNHFGDYDDMPFIHFDGASPSTDPDLRAISSLRRVATNKPSFIELNPDSFNVLGHYRDGVPINGKALGPAIVAVPQSTAVIIADSGVLSNRLLTLTPRDSAEALDNLVFAIHLTAYLAHGPNRSASRNRCIFYENGQRITDFDRVSLSPEIPDVRPSWPMIQRTIAENVEKKVNELQNEDFPNRNLLNNVPFRTIVQRLGQFAAIATAIFLLLRVRGARNERENSQERQAGIEAVTTAAAILQSNNLWPAARERLRRQFAAWQVPEQPSAPAVAVEGSWFYRKRMEKSIRTLWAIAFGDSPARVSKRRWEELDRMVDDIDHALLADKLRFPTAEPTS